MATRPSESMKHLRKLGHKGVEKVEHWVSFDHGGPNQELVAAVLSLLDAGLFCTSDGHCTCCGWYIYDHKESCEVGIARRLAEQYPPPKPATGQRAEYAGGYRKDLWGFADIICFRCHAPGIIVVQCTSATQVTAHVRKYRRDPDVRANILACLAAGNRVVIHGWEKTTVQNKSGDGSHTRWVLTEKKIAAKDMELTDADKAFLSDDF